MISRAVREAMNEDINNSLLPVRVNLRRFAPVKFCVAAACRPEPAGEAFNNLHYSRIRLI